MYNENDIKPLNPTEHIRMRPGMYIGGVDERALHIMVYEVMDNAVNEILEGYGDHLWIVLKPNHTIVVRDNGRGIRVSEVESWGKNSLEITMMGMGQGRHGKYDLSGLGIWAVNALSASCTAEVARDGYLWQQTYRAGVPQTAVTQVRPLADNESTGTTITFTPDFTIFEPNDFRYDLIIERVWELAYLIPNLTIEVRDERAEPHHEDHFNLPTGLAQLVTDLNAERSSLHEVVTSEQEWSLQPTYRGSSHPVKVDFALQYTDSMDTVERSYANTINTTEGGTHLSGLWAALISVINEYAANDGDEPFTQREIAAGLTIVVSIKHEYLTFESQTRAKLINPEVFGVVAGIVYYVFHSPRKMDWKLQLPPIELREIILKKCRANRVALRETR